MSTPRTTTMIGQHVWDSRPEVSAHGADLARLAGARRRRGALSARLRRSTSR